MKLFFSLYLLVICHSTFASILITYDEERTMALQVVQLLQDKFQIPPNLMEMKWKKKPCDPLKEFILQICVGNDKKFNLPIVRSEILKNSFAIFHSRT